MDPELIAQIERIAELSAEELVSLEGQLFAAFEEIEAAEITAESVTSLREVAAALETIRSTIATREEEAETLAAEVAALGRAARGEDDETEETSETDEAEADEAEGDEGEEADEGEAAEEAEPQAVAASSTSPTPLATLAGRSSRMPRRNATTLSAAADVPGWSAGARIRPNDIGRAFMARHEALRGGQTDGKFPVVRLDYAGGFGAQRTLGPNWSENHRRVRDVTGRQAIVAAGGRCAPSDVLWDLAMVSSPARPVRDAMARFGADRGGLRYVSPPKLSAMAGAVDIITEAEDTEGATKPCLTVACGADRQVDVSAVTRCLRLGNFNARFFPEQTDTHLDLVMAQHAREADQELLRLMGTSTDTLNVTAETVLGTFRDVMATILRAGAGMRQRHRLEDEVPLHLIAPQWLKANMITDLVRQAPGDDTYARARAIIADGFRAANINVDWSLEGATAAQSMSGAQIDGGALNGWPTNVVMYMYPEGSWLFLDGGTLDLGIVRDSTLNLANDFQIFAETFEAAADIGVETLEITLDICPDGSSSLGIDINPCATGS